MALSFKTRLWLGHVTILAAMLAAAAFAGDWALRRVVLGRIIDDAILSLASTEAAALQADAGQRVRVHEIAPGAGPPSFVRLDKFVQITDLDGRVIAHGATLGTSRLPTAPALLARLRDGETVFQTVTDFGEEPVRMVSLPVTAGPTNYVVQVAMSLDDAYAVLSAGRWLFLTMSLVILTAIGLTGALLARRALRPIDRIVARARRLEESNLAERLPHPGSKDEIGRLVETLNDMLARLERGFEVQRRFTADASHEIRSPLSRLRAELEVTLRRPRSSAEYQETLRSCLDEVERLSRLTEELLVLARLDAGDDRQAPAGSVALTPILEDAVRRYLPEARRRQVQVTLEPSPVLSVTITPGAASLVVTNLLDNALKFSPSGGRVIVSLTAEQGNAVVAVSDTGPGIPADELPMLFERFHRGTASRSGSISGVGLGLAISRAIVEGHGGRITVESAPGGATFSVRLPLAV